MKLLEDPIKWPFIATILCVVWSLIFWKLFFVELSWEILRIPMGLGGAIYFMFFLIPVFIGSCVYEFGISSIIQRKSISLKPSMRIVVSLLIPFFIIAVVLIVYCPMDIESSYLEYLFNNVLMK